MIKKINILLVSSVAVLFGLSLLLDLLEGKRGASRSEPAAEEEAATRFAPTVYYAQWHPYFSVDPISNHNGYVLDIVRAVFPEAKFVRKECPPAGFAELLDADPMSACVNFGQHPALARHAAAPSPIGYYQPVVYLPRGSKWHYTEPASLDEICIGVDPWFFDSEVIRDFCEKWKGDPGHVRILDTDDRIEGAMKLIDSGEIKAFVDMRMDMYELQYRSSRQIIWDFRFTDPIDRVYMLFRPSSADPAVSAALIEAWEAGMKRITESGEKRRIQEYYGFKD